VRPIGDVGPERQGRCPPACYRGARARYVGADYGTLTVSPWKCARLLKALELNHRQIVEAALIRAEAIGRTESHTEIAMKDQAERFPTVVALRQMSSLALHLRSPFPRLRKTNAKAFGGFPKTQREDLIATRCKSIPGIAARQSGGMERFRIA
jgi:hypothetical protein